MSNISNEDGKTLAVTDEAKETTDTLKKKLKSIYNIDIGAIQTKYSVTLRFETTLINIKIRIQGEMAVSNRKKIKLTISKNSGNNNEIKLITGDIFNEFSNIIHFTNIGYNDDLGCSTLSCTADLSPKNKNREANFEGLWKAINSQQSGADAQVMNDESKQNKPRKQQTKSKNPLLQNFIYYFKLFSPTAPLVAGLSLIFIVLAFFDKISNTNNKNSSSGSDSKARLFSENNNKKENNETEQQTEHAETLASVKHSL